MSNIETPSVREMLSEEADFIFHFDRIFSMEDKDDFIYSYFNGRSPCPDERRRDAQPRQSHSNSTLACRKHTATEKKPANVKEPLQSSRSCSGDTKSYISCPVCIAPGREIISSRRFFVVTLCGHVFCNQCMESIMENGELCPTCRTAISRHTNRRLYF